MAVLKDLASIKKAIESRPTGGDRVDDRELTRNIKAGKDRTIRFVQELDPDSKYYDERFGTATVAPEYEHPKLYWLKLVDTFEDEGKSWPSEQGWASKLNLYINVVDVDTGDVFYLARSVLGGLGQQIVENAGDRGSLTDSVWKIKKKGEGMQTRYNLSLVNIVDLDEDPIDVDPDDLIDFEEQVLNQVPYAEQEAFVRQVEQRVKAKADDAGAESSDDDDDDDVW
jgi:hypothetical protein